MDKKTQWNELFPNFGLGAFSVWFRNFRYFTYTWKHAFMWVLLEPMMYLGAMGFGVGRFIEDINGMAYIDFFFPAILANTALTVPFMEATYGAFTKLTQQKTFSTILLTRVSVGEVVWGEILWGVTKGLLGVLGVVFISSFFGLLKTPMIFPAMIFLFLTSLISASAGLLVTALARDYNSFIYAISGVIIPMSLFSGTYFPLDGFPSAVQTLAHFLPLTYSVEAVRGLLNTGWQNTYLINALVLLLFASFFIVFSYRKMKKRLIK